MEHKHIKFMRNTELYQYAYSLYESLSESELMINSDVSASIFKLIFCLMELKCRGLSERSDFVEKAELFCKKYIEQSYAAYNKPEGESKEAEFTELPEVLDQLTVEKASSKMQVKGFMDYATKLHFIPQIFHESKKDKRKSDNIPKSRIIFMKKEHSFFKKRSGEREVKKLSALPVLFKETELIESAKGGCGWIKGLQNRLLRKKKQSDAGYGLDSRLTVDIPMMGIPLPFLGFILFQIFVVEFCIDPLIWSLVPITLLTAFSFLFGLCNLPRVKSVVKFLRSEDYRVRLLQKDEKSVTKLMLLGWVIRTNFRGLYFKEYGVRLGEDFLDTGSDFVKEKFRIYATDLDNYIDIDMQEVKLRDMSYLMFSSVEDLRIRITDLSQLYWGRFHSIDTLMDCDNNAERVYSMYRDKPEVLNIVTTLMSQERCSAVYCKESGFKSVLRSVLNIMCLEDRRPETIVTAQEFFQDSVHTNRELKSVTLYLIEDKLNSLHGFIKSLWGSLFSMEEVNAHLDELLTYYRDGVPVSYAEHHYQIYGELMALQKRILTADVMELVFILLNVEVLYCKYRSLQADELSYGLAVI